MKPKADKTERAVEGLLARLEADGLIAEGLWGIDAGHGGLGLLVTIFADGIPDRDALGKFLERTAFQSMSYRVYILAEGIEEGGDVTLWVNSEPLS